MSYRSKCVHLKTEKKEMCKKRKEKKDIRIGNKDEVRRKRRRGKKRERERG